MTVVEFPVKDAEWTKPKTLEDWPWDPDLGRPYMDINETAVINIRQPCYIGEAPPSAPEYTPVSPDHYKHYGVECIELTENMPFLEGNIVKYVYRHRSKDGKQDLLKARWYLDRLIAKYKD